MRLHFLSVDLACLSKGWLWVILIQVTSVHPHVQLHDPGEVIYAADNLFAPNMEVVQHVLKNELVLVAVYFACNVFYYMNGFETHPNNGTKQYLVGYFLPYPPKLWKC